MDTKRELFQRRFNKDWTFAVQVTAVICIITTNLLELEITRVLQ